MIYYISDLHLMHYNVINMCYRPFKSLEEMNETLINNWNNTVKNNDIVYFLGDFSYKCSQQQAITLFKRLNGQKYFIKGNHDKTDFIKSLYNMGLIKWYENYAEINDNNRMVILCHYPLHDWNGMYRGSYHLYGHTHNNVAFNDDLRKNRFSVSVENISYKPITLDELIKLNKKEN